MTDRPSLFINWLGSFIHRDQVLDVRSSIAEIQSDQIEALSHQLESEKRRNAQLILLNELSQQLDTRLDQPVAAQLAMNTLERAIGCSYACLLVHEPERR